MTFNMVSSWPVFLVTYFVYLPDKSWSAKLLDADSEGCMVTHAFPAPSGCDSGRFKRQALTACTSSRIYQSSVLLRNDVPLPMWCLPALRQSSSAAAI